MWVYKEKLNQLEFKLAGENDYNFPKYLDL